jgi:tripartite-type tricarboxylate transporter receptor subunit TctC
MPTHFTRRHALGALASAASAVALPAWAQAPAYPARSVKLVVGASPGGPSDFLARVMADAISPALKQSFVVDNKPGASGMPAAENVVKSAADGHTLLVSGPASIAVMPHLFSKITYAPLVDLTPITMLGAGAFVLVVHPSVSARNVQELIALAKAKPDGLAYGSGGNGSSGHLCTELFSQQVGAKMIHVPYKGDGQAMNDLLAGQVQVMFTAPNVAMAHVKAGRLRLLAVTTRDRVASLPETPTVHEAGVRDFEYLGWIIVFAPAGTPQPVIDTLAAAWQGAKGSAAVRGKLEELAMSAPERLGNRPALLEFVKNEHARLGKLIRDAGVKTE